MVDRLAAANRLRQFVINQNDVMFLELSASEWILLSSNPQTFDDPNLQAYGESPKGWAEFVAWTDDYNNLFELLQSAY